MSAAARRGIGRGDLKRNVAVAVLLWGCRILCDFPEVFISAVAQCLRFSRTSLVAFNAFQPPFSFWISLQGDRVLRFYSALLQFGRASSSLFWSLAIAAALFPSLSVYSGIFQPVSASFDSCPSAPVVQSVLVSSSLVRFLAMAADLFPSFFAASVSTSRLICGCSCLGSVGRTWL